MKFKGLIMQILVADDSKTTLGLLTLSLKELGHDVMAATSGLRRPDLLVLRGPAIRPVAGLGDRPRLAPRRSARRLRGSVPPSCSPAPQPATSMSPHWQG